MKKSSGGRPRHGEQVKSVPIGIRTSPELRSLIEQAAASRKVSMTQEIERRLEQSFESGDLPLPADLAEIIKANAAAAGVPAEVALEDILRRAYEYEAGFQSNVGLHLARILTSLINFTEVRTGKSLDEDYETWHILRTAIRQQLDHLEPATLPDYEREYWLLEAKWGEAAKRSREISERLSELQRLRDGENIDAAPEKPGEWDGLMAEFSGINAEIDAIKPRYNELTDIRRRRRQITHQVGTEISGVHAGGSPESRRLRGKPPMPRTENEVGR